MTNVVSNVAGTVKNWWAFLIIGILLVVGAFWMFRTPAESFAGLSGIFSILILLSGILTIFYAFGNKEDIDSWGLFLAGGILDIVVGLVLLNYPGITMVLFAVFVGFWLLFKGISTISTAFKLKNESVDNWGWVLVFGVLIVIFAFMSIINPLIGASYLVYTLAFALLLLGLSSIFISLKLRKVKVRVGDTKDYIAENVGDLKDRLK